ncbi:receptor-like protein 6 [Quercus suber]|uniref:receptor-like protein 6 n=1 Tax=Quercus suber TaxID=58331 RepID=UPI0032E013EA
MPLCHSYQSSALLHFRNSFFDRDSDYYCDLYSILRRIHGKWVQIVMGGMGSPVIRLQNSWKVGTDCCGWNGVTCDTITGHVIIVDLSCSRLYGPIHPNSTLFSLHHLQRLNLAYNHFNRSAISSKFGGFANMTHLNLSGSSFIGNFPSEISHLSKLVSLDLSLNDGIIMKTSSLKRLVQNLTHLTELFLNDVNMSFVSPNSFMNLSSSLTSLSLRYCGLKGRFPDNIFHLPNLQLLWLGYNDNLTDSLPTYNWSTPLKSLELSGTEFTIDLPNLISNLKSLKKLYLKGCNFIGSYPTFLPNLTQITSLALSDNNSGGQFPWSLLNFEVLTYLDLSRNNFIGQLLEVMTNLTQIFSSNNSSNSQLVNKIPSNLEFLILSGNLLNETIPSWVYIIPSLRYLYLGHNQFTGHIGDFQHNSLVGLGLNNNNLSGPLPLSISKLVSLRFLVVSFNNLSGNVESKIFFKLKNLIDLEMSSNPLLSLSFFTFVTNILPKIVSLQLSSSNITEIPHFLQTAKYIDHLDLSNNQIKGNIPKWFLEVGKDSLYYLNLSYNSLTSVGHLSWKNLRYLDFRSNLLQGPLPVPPLGISFFSVSRNNITGQISSSFCNLSSIEYLDLSYNHVSNMIPPCFGNFSDNLIDLDLQNKNLNGTLPTKFAKGCRLRSLKLNGNQSEGSLPQSLVCCRKLEVLDFGKKKINSSFPRWLETLPELRVLILRSKNFHGALGNPKTKSPFPNLRIIDLSQNEFDGHLPTNLFKYLKAMMNVSVTKGKLKYMGDDYYQDFLTVVMKGFFIELIPQGKQFNTFTNDSYNGNRRLCGFPMTKACGNDEGPPPRPSTIQEDDFKFENGFHWKVVLLGYGCGFVFELVLGYLVFSSGKPKWILNIVFRE